MAEVAHRIDVPTLLISGHPEVIATQEAQGLPFLSKPFRLPELQQAMRTLIDGEPVATEPAKPDYNNLVFDSKLTKGYGLLLHR